MLYRIEYNIETKTISENLSIDNTIVLKRDGKNGELRLGDSVSQDKNLDSETLFLRTASFNTGRFPQEPVLHEMMDYLFNSYCIDGYNQGAHWGKNIFKYTEENGVDKINQYLRNFNYDFFVEYSTEIAGEWLKISVGSEKKVVFLNVEIILCLFLFLMNRREIRCLPI